MATSLDPVFAALGDPTRRAVIDLLHNGPRAAGELADAFDLSPPAMSRQLRVLRRTGLVEEERADREDARLRVYRLRREPFLALRDWLDDIESFWTEQLSAFKEHAEKPRPARGRKKK